MKIIIFIKVFYERLVQYTTTLYAIILTKCIFFFGHHALIEVLALNRNPFIKAFYFSGVRLSGS